MIKLRYPDYASEILESPVHNETPDLPIEQDKTNISNHRTASLPHIHHCNTEHLEYQYLSEHKKNAFKTGAFAGTIEAAVLKKHSKNIRLMNDLEIED